MSEWEGQLSQRREALRARCAVQRHQLGESAAEIEEHLGGLDRGIHMVRTVARSPLFITGAISLLVLIGPRRILRWVTRGALAWSTSRRLLRLARY